MSACWLQDAEVMALETTGFSIMSEHRSHPAQRFEAPSGIMAGVPLKEVLNRQLIPLIGESFAAVLPTFKRRTFERRACEGLDDLEFTPRGEHIGRALTEQLPADFSERCDVMIRAMGPELTATEGNGIAVFFYLPHSCAIASGAIENTSAMHAADFDAGMRAIYELTKRMTGEFCIRHYFIADQERCLKHLNQWISDPNPHVRRLVSEGTRSRLPWAIRLKAVQADPSLTLPLLERLKDDEELYVRRSVANHLADVLKDHPDVAYEVCERWLDELTAKGTNSQTRAARCWIIRHAVRLPAKKGDARALALRERAK